MPLTHTRAAAALKNYGFTSAQAGGGGGPADPYFNQTTLLLHGDGTNGAQNNTFLDSSTNNFTVTRNGNTTQGTFSPFSQDDGKWGAYFDGSGDYLSTASDSAFRIVNGDFCVEGWFYMTAAQASRGLVSSYFNNNGWIVRLDTSDIRLFAGNGEILVIRSYTFSQNTWYHFAFTRSGNTIRCFVNGVQQGADATVSTATDTTATGVQIGRTHTVTNDFAGYMSNIRIVKGSAVYTSAFTPSTTPLTAISGTSLLTCQSNRFKDNSANNFAITVNGNTSIQPFSPFAPSAAYSAATNGGSGYFDGSGDYLTTSSSITTGTGAFTVEAWIWTTVSNQKPEIWQRSSLISDFVVSTNFNAADAGVILGETTTAGSGYSTLLVASTALTANAWNHVAWVRSSGVITVYINGVASGTVSSAINSQSLGTIGAFSAATYDFSGYISNLRVTNTAVYTSAFTPPTSPVTAISGTSLLCNFTNAGILDNTGRNDLETVGNAQISTSVKKFGTGSLAFDGTGDYIAVNNATFQALGTGNFTIEMWLYSTSTAVQFPFSYRNGATTVVRPDILINFPSAGNISWYVSATNQIVGTGFSANTWHHVAVSRSGTSTKMFLNGTQVGSTYTDSNNYLAAEANGPFLGGLGSYESSGRYFGYIDDLRITKGVARYTGNFTPPTAAFEDQ